MKYFICDKCGFNTSALPLLIKHKTNEHNNLMSNSQCDFKAFKRDVQLILHSRGTEAHVHMHKGKMVELPSKF